MYKFTFIVLIAVFDREILCTFWTQKVQIAVCDWCCLPLFGRLLTAVFARGVLCTFWPQKVPKALRRMPLPMPSRLTLAPGARLKGGFKGRWAAERIISDTTLSLLKPASYAGARAFSPHLFERLFCQAGVVRRETRREKSAFSLAAEKEQPTARVPGAGGCIVLFLLHPLNAGRRLFPRKRHADGFGTFNFATLVFLLLARHSPQAVSARAACVGCHQKVVQTTAVRRE